ncbi:MAG: TIR domain-containing protein [Gemmatimonadota bacterium]
MTGTFISYRQDDAKPWALLLRDELVEAFGEDRVFLDKDALHAGSWRDQLQEALTGCGVVLVVIGRRWLSVESRDGTRRLDDPTDVHRGEVATALARDGVTVIPVLVDGATMPQPERLPEDLRALVEQQARTLSDRSDHRQLDLAALIADIEQATGVVASRHAPSDRRSRSRLGWVVGLATTVASIYVGVQIDYRHWSWIVFLVVLPATALAFLMWPTVRSNVDRWQDRHRDDRPR